MAYASNVFVFIYYLYILNVLLYFMLKKQILKKASPLTRRTASIKDCTPTTSTRLPQHTMRYLLTFRL